MVPLRQALIVEEQGTLRFPEGTACAEVLLAGEEGGAKAGTVSRDSVSRLRFVRDGLSDYFPSEMVMLSKAMQDLRSVFQLLSSCRLGLCREDFKLHACRRCL